MMRGFKLISLFLLLLLLGSCSAYKEIAVKEYKITTLELNSTNKIDATFSVTINNPTKKEITLLEADIEAFLKETPLAHGSLPQEVVIPARGEHQILVSYRVDIDNPLLLLATGLNFNNLSTKQINNITLNIDATLKQGSIKKRFKYKNIPLAEFIAK